MLVSSQQTPINLTLVIRQLVLVSVALLGSSLGRLSIYSPNSLLEHYSSFGNSINYVMSRFGEIPYNKKVIAPLYMGNPWDACAPIQVDENPEELAFAPAVLIQNGNCSFVTKIRNAQHFGAILAIVYEDKENLTEKDMVDDGHGYDIEIPSILISKLDGHELKKFIDKDNNVIIVMNFEPQLNKNSYNIYLDNSYPVYSFAFVAQLYKYHTWFPSCKIISLFSGCNSLTHLFFLEGLHASLSATLFACFFGSPPNATATS